MRIAISIMLGALAVGGCGTENPNPQAAAADLQKSFQAAGNSVTQEIHQATTAFKTGNYVDAMTILNHVAGSRPMDAAQKKAIDTIVVQTRKAVQQDSKLDSPQLYRAMSDLVVRVHGEN